MIDLNKVVLKKDCYEFEILLEFKNCDVLQVTDEFICVKPKHFNKINEIKQDIIKMSGKNPELYCDCKKVIYNNDTFEEVINIKRNSIDITPGENYSINAVVCGAWISKSSYGPIIKLLSYKSENKQIDFLPDPDDYSSDQEINESIQHYAKINQFKEKSKRVKKKNEQSV